MIATHFEGSRQAYLDWVCVLKSHRHQGIAQKLMKALREQLKQQGITTLVGLIASNEEAQRFYRSLPDSKIQDDGFGLTFSSRNFPIIYYKRKATVQLHSRLPFYIR